MSETGPAIAAALANVTFEQGELAYLALCSKPEGQVRDRLAWALMKAGFAAAREWDARRDLAVWSGGEPAGAPAAVVELKACHTFDLCAGRRWLGGEIAKDIAKADSLPSTVEAFLLVVVTHLEWGSARPAAVVKYARRADHEEAATTLAALLNPLGETSRVRLDEGEAFGVRAEVDAWLCGPMGKTKPATARPIRAKPTLVQPVTAKPLGAESKGGSMAWSDLIEQLTAGFELHTNRDGKYGPIYTNDRRRIGQVQRWEPDDRLWLKEPNGASEGLFDVTEDKTWKGGRCSVTKETLADCRRALELAAAVRRPGAT